MKRTRFLVLTLCLAVASVALGAEAIYSPRQKIQQAGPNAPWEPVLSMRIVNAAAADTNGIHARYVAYPSGTDTTYTFSTAEKAAFAVESAKALGGRSLAVQTCDATGANDNGIKASAITITGTNALGATITTVFTPTDNTAGAATETAVTAFKTISTIKIVKMDDAGALVSVGFGSYWGLPITLPENTVLTATCDGTREATFPTVTFSATDIEKNAITFNTAANGTKDFCVHFLWPAYGATTAANKW